MKPTSSLSACLASAKKTLTPAKKSTVKSAKPPKPPRPGHTKDADQLSGGDSGGSISFNG